MKKLFILAMTLVMLVLTIAVGAEDVELKIEPMFNYSTDAVVSLDFTTADELTAAIVEMDGEAPDVFDPVTLFETLLSFDGKATVEADISEDYNKIKLSMQASYDYDVDVNPNLGIGLDLKMGAWLDMDLSDLNNPRCDVILYTPMSTKYMYCNLFDYIPDDQNKLMTVAMLKMILNEEFISDINQTLLDAYEKNAEITVDGDVATIKLSNDALLRIIDELIPVFVEKVASAMSVPEEQLEYVVIPSISEMGIQLLGENGFVVKYNTKDYSSEINCDININLSDLMATFVGEEYPYENDMILGFTMTGTETYYDIGKTVVDFPELSEENSINLKDVFLREHEYYEEDYYEPEYPFFYTSTYETYMPDVEGEIYVPFRALLEDAYGGNVNIEFDNGHITVTSEYFTDFEKLSFKVGDSKANVDGSDFNVGEIILKDGVTYVSKDFFEIIFGWKLSSASYDMMYNEYYFSFYTDPVDDFWYEEDYSEEDATDFSEVSE